MVFQSQLSCSASSGQLEVGGLGEAEPKPLRGKRDPSGEAGGCGSQVGAAANSGEGRCPACHRLCMERMILCIKKFHRHPTYFA